MLRGRVPIGESRGVAAVEDHGQSGTQIDATYGHLVPDSENYLRSLLDAYDGKVLDEQGAITAERAENRPT